jgi:hypothetical protein
MPIFPLRCYVAVLCFSLLAGQHTAAEELAAPPTDSDGYVDLFATGDFSLWKIDGSNDSDRAQQAKLWSISDGVIAAAGKKYGFIRYDKKLCDFSCRLEYCLQRGGNSGVGIRGAIYQGGNSRPSRSGYELQLLADAGRAPNNHSSMSLYRYVAPTENAVREPGEWNQLEITCRGPHITVILNGKTVQDVDQSQNEKIKNKPLCGYLLLQNHGAPVEFRHVRLKELGEDQ